MSGRNSQKSNADDAHSSPRTSMTLTLKKKDSQKSAIGGAGELSKLQDQADNFTRKIEIERRKIEELDRQLSTTSKRILDQKLKLGGLNAVRDNNRHLEKQIRTLENKLEKAKVKFNEILSKNKNVREEVDNIRRERVVYQTVYKKLDKELVDKKAQMDDIVTDSKKAFEAREMAQREISDLRDKAEKEQEKFEREWKELGKMIEEERRAKDKRQNTQEPTEFRGALSVEEEEKLKKKIVKNSWGILKDKASQQATMDKIHSYEEAFEKIQEATGINDIDALVQSFVDAEEKNYNLWNYVNELRSESEKLEEQVVDLRNEIEKYKGQGANSENQRKKILEDLEMRLVKAEEKVNVYEGKHTSAVKSLEVLRTGILALFNKIGCKIEGSEDILGEEGVTEANMMQYLGMIEQRVNEILQTFLSAQAPGGPDPSVGAATLQSIITGSTKKDAGSSKAPISIVPPSAGTDESDEDDEEENFVDDDRPLSRDELRQRTMQVLSRTDQATAGSSPRGEKKAKSKNSRRRA